MLEADVEHSLAFITSMTGRHRDASDTLFVKLPLLDVMAYIVCHIDMYKVVECNFVSPKLQAKPLES